MPVPLSQTNAPFHHQSPEAIDCVRTNGGDPIRMAVLVRLGSPDLPSAKRGLGRFRTNRACGSRERRAERLHQPQSLKNSPSSVSSSRYSRTFIAQSRTRNSASRRSASAFSTAMAASI